MSFSCLSEAVCSRDMSDPAFAVRRHLHNDPSDWTRQSGLRLKLDRLRFS